MVTNPRFFPTHSAYFGQGDEAPRSLAHGTPSWMFSLIFRNGSPIHLWVFSVVSLSILSALCPVLEVVLTPVVQLRFVVFLRIPAATFQYCFAVRLVVLALLFQYCCAVRLVMFALIFHSCFASPLVILVTTQSNATFSLFLFHDCLPKCREPRQRCAVTKPLPGFHKGYRCRGPRH